jgi:NADH-quinone oxidoreductase subunit L
VNLLPLLPLFPLVAGVVLLLTGRRWPRRAAGWLAAASVTVSFVLAVALLTKLLGMPVPERELVKQLYQWIAAGGFVVDVAFRGDPLSTVMALTVTGVGALIFVYSIAYMDGDARYARFFAYLCLFVFFMLILVLAQNFLFLYVGWEGVGLCSYLLIGHWYERPAAAAAAKKAFIVTRVGDAAFLVGIVLLWSHFHSLDFSVVLASAGSAAFATGSATVIALLFLAGAAGKSAQLPLHTWLPDAMEGPTPVSALIHAATMVTAGVYLIVRSEPIFARSPAASTTVAVIGVATSLYAGLSAIGQDDIKRVLAYSTISQIGLMLLAAGVGAPSAAIFLLVTHAFYKALLFLSAGSVIHGLHDEQDMMKMGGLRRVMPFTASAWIVGALAISGIPPLAGFFSKDQAVAAASLAGREGLWLAGLAASLLTAVYIWRATFMTFFGPPRYEGEPHEPSPIMRVPMSVLAAASALGGLLGLSATDGALPRFLGATEIGTSGPPESVLTVIAVAVALLGLALAWFVYGSGRLDWVALRVRFAGLKRASMRAFYVDDAYSMFLGDGGKLLAAALAAFDHRGIDGLVGSVARGTGLLAGWGRRVQTGLVRTYALAFLAGVVGILWFLVGRAT